MNSVLHEVHPFEERSGAHFTVCDSAMAAVVILLLLLVLLHKEEKEISKPKPPFQKKKKNYYFLSLYDHKFHFINYFIVMSVFVFKSIAKIEIYHKKLSKFHQKFKKLGP